MKEKLFLSSYYHDPDYPRGIVFIEFLHEDFKEGTLLKDLYKELIEMKNIKTRQELALESYKLQYSQLSSHDQDMVDMNYRDNAKSESYYYEINEKDPDFGERLVNELSDACLEHIVIAKEDRGWNKFEKKIGLGWVIIELSRDKKAFYNDSFWKIT